MNKGFSLIELVITLGIIAILASIAYPNYQQHLQKARRIDARIALLNLAAHLEDYYSEQGSYQHFKLTSQLSPQGWYIMSIQSQTDDFYSLSATPRYSQAKDKLCQTYTFDRHGLKGISAGPQGQPEGSVENCWG